MDDITIVEGKYGKLVFTTNSSFSHYGMPVVRCYFNTCDDCKNCNHYDFGPADTVPDCIYSSDYQNTFGEYDNMANYINDWVNIKSTDEKLKLVAEKWLSQMPKF